MGGLHYAFCCRHWFAPTLPIEPGHVCQLEPYLEDPHLVWPTATVSIVTAPLWNSGTDGRVRMRIFGSTGSSADLDLSEAYHAQLQDTSQIAVVQAKRQPSNAAVPFQQGSSDTVRVQIHDVGQIDHIDLSLDCTGVCNSWQVDTITIQCDKGVQRAEMGAS
jgi:hypothetical protein